MRKARRRYGDIFKDCFESTQEKLTKYRDTASNITEATACVAGKVFSRGHIRNFYYKVKQKFDELWEEINKVYLLGTIKMVGEMLLDS